MLQFGGRPQISAFEQVNEESKANDKNLNFYGFNSRMVPESLATSKPVYRPLNKRTPEEMALIEALTKKKRRKSRSVQPSKSKIPADENDDNFLNQGKKKRAAKGKKKQ